MLSPKEILIKNGFRRSPNSHFNAFLGKSTSFERWDNQIKQPKNDYLKEYEGIEVDDNGFFIFWDNYKLCDISILRFPKYATELDFLPAFERMSQFLNANYEYKRGVHATYSK